MVKTKKLLKKSGKKEKKKKTKKKTRDIVDVIFSKNLNKGSLASSNKVDYHYQHQNNILDFLNKLYKQKFLDDISFFSKPNDATLNIDIINKKVQPLYISNDFFIRRLKKCLHKRFTPISVRALLPINKKDIESHANIIIIDSKFKKIEIFEPHGYKKKYSDTYESVSKYHNKIDLLKIYFKKILPKYRLVNIVNHVKNKSFQSRYDARSGYCVTWSTLYAHYRILNPKVKVSKLLHYLKIKIKKNLLLRYASYIEEKLKDKI